MYTGIQKQINGESQDDEVVKMRSYINSGIVL